MMEMNWWYFGVRPISHKVTVACGLRFILRSITRKAIYLFSFYYQEIRKTLVLVWRGCLVREWVGITSGMSGGVSDLDSMKYSIVQTCGSNTPPLTRIDIAPPSMILPEYLNTPSVVG